MQGAATMPFEKPSYPIDRTISGQAMVSLSRILKGDTVAFGRSTVLAWLLRVGYRRKIRRCG